MTILDSAHIDGNATSTPLKRVMHWYRNWTARRQIRRLAGFDARMLADMGVTRDEVLWASKLPLSVNAAWELRHRSHTRRLAERAIR